MSLYSQFKTNKNAEESGIVVKFKANEDGSIPSFRIGRANRFNIKWAKTFEAETRPFKNDLEAKLVSEQDAEKINIRVFVKGLLYGFENVQDENGKLIEFNEENAIKLLSDLPDLFDILDKKSNDPNNFLQVNLKEDAKN